MIKILSYERIKWSFRKKKIKSEKIHLTLPIHKAVMQFINKE